MNIKKLPNSTRIYLTSNVKNRYNKNKFLYIKPGKTLINYNLYVAYDVKIDGVIIIPKGTRVIGDWVTETSPSIAAQYQLSRVFLYGSGQEIEGESDVIETLTDYNNEEIDDVSFLYGVKKYKTTSNLTRRIIKYQHKNKSLFDDNRNSIYIEISTMEIPITITKDFVPFLNFEK